MADTDAKDNPNPVLHAVEDRRLRRASLDPVIDEAFDAIRNIEDPEHPYTLEELGVVAPDTIQHDAAQSVLTATFTPTVPHCSMSNLIGLMIMTRLRQTFPFTVKIDVRVAKNTHLQEDSLNKQLADKERVCAAMENPHLLQLIESKFQRCN
jgi:metal-sulfur cluster biosynthetic enzyme